VGARDSVPTMGDLDVWTRRVAQRLVVVLAASALVAAALPLVASAATCVGPAAVSNVTLPIPDNGSVESTIVVAGAQSYLADVDAITRLTHTFPGDLDVTLTSPAGTVVTLTTDNASGSDNVFNGTRWDDDADPGSPLPYGGTSPSLVTDHTYANLVVAPLLAPEEPLGAFIGEDPNGTWTLKVVDDSAGDMGTLSGWSLDLRTLPQAPAPPNVVTFANVTDVPIPDNAPAGATSTILVAGAQPYLADVDAITHLTHTFPGDLDIALTSPAGTVVTLTTDNANTNDNVFNGTRWDDDADPGSAVPYGTTSPSLVTDHTYANLVVAPLLAPEEPLGAFIGEDPNGTWTLKVIDDAAGDTGTLLDWSLAASTLAAAPACPAVSPPPPPPPPATPPAFSALSVSPARFRAASRGASVARHPVQAAKRKKRKPAPIGTAVSYSLDKAATVTFTVERGLPGRRGAGRCVKPTRANRGRARCTRYSLRKGSFTHAGATGRNSLRFSGRLGGRKLPAGDYRLVGSAATAAGKSATKRAVFHVVRR
jgi:subtilisin-like proprotein convertase family protein